MGSPRTRADTYRGEVMKSDSLSYPSRGLSREEAARYVGAAMTKFDQMVADRRMPKPKKVDGRVIWDRLKLEAAFTELPGDDDENIVDFLFARESPQGIDSFRHDRQMSRPLLLHRPLGVSFMAALPALLG